jgi:hypothetical protein
MQSLSRRFLIVKGIAAAQMAVVCAGQPVPSAVRRVYVDKMFGLEATVEKALKDQELPFEFVEEAKQPELKAGIRKKNSSFYGEILYREKIGRNEDHTLELYDVEKKKVVAYYDFKLVADAQGREAIAREFAKRVAAAVNKKK